MKILYVSHYSTLGGANIELATLCVEMRKRGNEVIIAVPSEGPACEYFEKNNIPYIVIPYKRWIYDINSSLKRKFLLTVMTYLNNLKYKRILMNYIKDNSVDIVHTNDALTVVGSYAAYDAHVPHIWHLRELLEDDYQIDFLFSKKYVTKWFSRSQAVVAISKTVLEKYRSIFSKDNFQTVSDGIDLTSYDIESINKRNINDTFSILYTGGTSEKKGFKDVIYIANELKKLGFEFKVLITGDCSSIDRYSQMINELKVKEYLKIKGFVNNLNEIRSVCDVFLMPSVKEAFGLVTVEAMLSNLIVVGRNSGGTSEIIQDKITGFLYDEGDYTYAANTIIDIYNMSNEDKLRIKQKAKLYAVAEYSIETTAEKLEMIYKARKSNE